MCYECKRKKGREWAIRLQEEIKAQKEKWFITLTFNNEKYKHFHNFTPNHYQVTVLRKKILEDGLIYIEIDDEIRAIAKKYSDEE